MRIREKIERRDSVDTTITVVQTAPRTFKVYTSIGDEKIWWSNHRTESAAKRAAWKLHGEMLDRYGE